MRLTPCVVVNLVLLAVTHAFAADPSPASAPAAPSPGVQPLVSITWDTLPPLPDPIGFAGPYAGVSNGALIVAGGANFPDGPPWEGHAKVWHDRVFVLERPGAEWRQAQATLPRPLGYGVSLTTKDGLLCIGGSDAKQHYADVFLLRWANGDVQRTELPPLPVPLANAAGALLGNIAFVAGGTTEPAAAEATHHFFSLDLSSPNPQWQARDPWPGPERMLAVAAAQEGSLLLFSGVRLVTDAAGKTVREYLRDAYRYTPGQGWRRIANTPVPVAAAPSPAPALGGSHVLVFGGDDGSNVNFEPKDRHPGFTRQAWTYHTITDSWTSVGEIPAAHVTTTVVPWAGGFVIPSGEIRPGVRSPAVLIASAARRRAAFGAVNYAALTLYLAAMVGIGVYFSRRNRSTDQFFRGGQRIPWWAAGLSIYATMLSSISYMAIPAKAYATDWAFYMNAIAILLVAPLVVYAYLPFYRQLDVTSAYEYLERRFNVAVRLFGSASFILLQVGRVAIVLYLPALALTTVSSFDIYTCIAVMGVLCVLYTVFGGIEAVIWTDVVQSIVLAGGALLAFALVVLRLDGGAGALLDVAAADNKLFQTVPFGWDTAAATASVVLVGSLFSNLVSYTASQDVVQRYVTTKDEKRAARAIWTNALIALPSSALFFAVGTALYAFYKAHPERLDPTLPTDAIFPLFMVRELPIGVAGLVVAGVFAAAQSTLSSSLNSVATACVTDFYRRFAPGSSDRFNLRLAQVITVLVGAVGIGVACVMASRNIASLWDLFLQLLGLTGGALAGLFALGIFTRRTHGTGAIVGAVTSAAVLYYVQRHTPINFFLFAGIGIVVCFVVGYAASLILPGGVQKPLDGLTVYTIRRARKMEPEPALLAG